MKLSREPKKGPRAGFGAEATYDEIPNKKFLVLLGLIFKAINLP